MLHPIVLGHGRRLFRDGIDTIVMTLVDAKPFKSGGGVLTYEPKHA